jgi:hypothetical protein
VLFCREGSEEEIQRNKRQETRVRKKKERKKSNELKSQLREKREGNVEINLGCLD